jgi:hypothetical protein
MPASIPITLKMRANRLSEWLPEAVRYEKIIRLIEPAKSGHERMLLHADVMKQKVCLYRE